MPSVSFAEWMAEAARGGYAVGYFESWNLESLMAVGDAAEAMRSPVLLGFSGIYLPHPARVVREPLGVAGARHEAGVAVEGEAVALPGVAGKLAALPEDLRLTDPDRARDFVQRTGVDAFAVNVGQAHLHGRRRAHLDLSRVAELKQALTVPLVLHGASSVDHADLTEAVRVGIRQVNVGRALQRGSPGD